ncbi:hypothetical protein GINT2_000732 [Glugoides intestinalis]
MDPMSNYSVYLLRDLDQDDIEDYIENRDTGMEAEEEKEIHLQDIIKGTGKDIPLPVIVEVKNSSRSLFDKKELGKKITWEKDCDNEYIENKQDLEIEKQLLSNTKDIVQKVNLSGNANADKSSFIPVEPLSDYNNLRDATAKVKSSPRQEMNDCVIKTVEDAGRMEENANTKHPVHHMQKAPSSLYETDNKAICFKDVIKNIGNNKSLFLFKNEAITNFCLKKTLIRYEKAGFEAYTCFRDRIFNPTFKSRRNEALMYEKINRMGIEFNTLKALCGLYREKCNKEYDVYKKTFKIVKKLSKSSFSKKKKRSLVKLFFSPVHTDSASRKRLNIHDLMTDRQKIVNLKNIKSSNELYIDIKYYNEILNIMEKTDIKSVKMKNM